MILLWILLTSFGQLLLYFLLNRLKLNFSGIFILLAVLGCYFFIFPPYFYPEPDPNPNHTQCGMPLLAINLGFWIFGGGVAILLHLIYFLIFKRTKKKVTK